MKKQNTKKSLAEKMQKTDTPKPKKQKKAYKNHVFLTREHLEVKKQLEKDTNVQDVLKKPLFSEGMKMLICFHVGFLIVLLGFLVIKLVPSLEEAVFGKTCFFITSFHLYCPGCGGTHALFSLLRFDLISAIEHNLFAVVLFFTTLYVDLRTILREIKYKDSKPTLPSVPYFSRYLLILLIVTFIASFALKNALLFWGIDPTGQIGNYRV